MELQLSTVFPLVFWGYDRFALYEHHATTNEIAFQNLDFTTTSKFDEGAKTSYHESNFYEDIALQAGFWPDM